MVSDLSIIIVNYNTSTLLDNSLKSIYANSKLDVEIIVVDNGSADSSVNRVKTKYPQVKLIENNDNYGFAKANNQGFRESTRKYVMYLNSDTIVKPLALEKIIEFMDLHPEVDFMGPKLVNEDGSLQISAFKLPNLMNSLGNMIFGFFYEPTLYNSYNETRPVGWVSGACLVARRDAFEKIGGWDENFFMYGEDILLGVRAHKLGPKVWYFPEAEIVHLRHRSCMDPHKRNLQGYESRIKLLQIIFSSVSFIMFLWFAFWIMFGRASFFLILYLLQRLLRKDSSFAQKQINNYLMPIRLYIGNTLFKRYLEKAFCRSAKMHNG